MTENSPQKHPPMRNATSVLLEVWQEACKHIEIQDFVQICAALLRKHLKLGALLVRRYDGESNQMLTVAAAGILTEIALCEDKQSLTAEQSRRLQQWARTGRLLERGKRSTGVAHLLIPAGCNDQILAGPLVVSGKFSGALILAAAPDQPLPRETGDYLERLMEPFSVALQNDRRIHEMASLREAAVADRGALLRKLGRSELNDVIVGETSGLKTVMQRVDLVSKLDVPVLILGETGTGKEVVARAIHNRSTRHEGPFIRVNCGAIPSELIDSQLFGHEKGSFTGADQSRQGWFERADGGTLFLDEIGELPLDAQVRFLRVLQDGFVERVGGNSSIHVDVRIVAATHRDLSQMVLQTKFREDLWYRLAIFPILIPPLRERIEDIPELAKHLAERAALRFGLPTVVPSPHDIQTLQRYSWPGNIRELGAVIDRAAILGEGTRLDVAIALGLGEPAQARQHSTIRLPQSPAPTLENFPTLTDVMRLHIEQALQLTHGQIEGRGGAADLLQINPHTLRARMRKLGINWGEFR